MTENNPKRYFKVKNWTRYKIHGDISGEIGVGLYRRLLSDLDFRKLPDVARGHLMLIWLLAAANSNLLEYDPDLIRDAISAKEPVNLDLLVSSGFLILSDPDQKDTSSSSITESFNLFYALYPIHIKREECYAIWESMTESERQAAIAFVRKLVTQGKSDDLRFRPEWFLKDKKWLDRSPVKANVNPRDEYMKRFN